MDFTGGRDSRCPALGHRPKSVIAIYRTWLLYRLAIMPGVPYNDKKNNNGKPFLGMMPSWSFLTRAKDDMSVWRAQWVDHPSVTWISRVQSLLEGRIFVFFSQRLERPKIEGKGKEETGNYQNNCKAADVPNINSNGMKPSPNHIWRMTQFCTN